MRSGVHGGSHTSRTSTSMPSGATLAWHTLRSALERGAAPVSTE